MRRQRWWRASPPSLWPPRSSVGCGRSYDVRHVGAGRAARGHRLDRALLVDGLVGERAERRRAFPWGTFAVNISGAALLGGVAGAAVTGNALILAGTATLGSYTTLSTWMLESHRLGQDDQLRRRAGQPRWARWSSASPPWRLGHAVGAAL